MKKIINLLLCLPLLFLCACDVHEWPEAPEFVKCHLRLNYDTDMTEWYHMYNDGVLTETGYGKTYDNSRSYGHIRYIVRTYPKGKTVSISDYTQEFVFTKEIANGYDHEVTLDIMPGNYMVMVWSDLVQTSGASYFHNAENFGRIMLQGEHKGNDDYRDAFRGTNDITLVSDIMERLPDTLDIAMHRPLAKYEFVTGDIIEFIQKESVRARKGNSDDVPTKTANIEDYKVVFHYVGFMPDTYSIDTDKPVDSSTGIFFETSLKQISESQASMGFDYVFVNGKASSVTVQIGIHNSDGEQLSITGPIEVPLKRSHHTLITGMFLTSELSGGVSINPGYDGEHNLYVK